MAALRTAGRISPPAMKPVLGSAPGELIDLEEP